MRKSFSDIGLPGGHQVLGLAYHPLSRILLAHIRPLKEPPRNRRLYFRRDTHDQYQPVGEFAEGVSIDSFVLDLARPSLYLLTYVWNEMKRDAGEGLGGYWDGLHRFDLEEHRCERLARPGDLLPMDGYHDARLRELLAVGPDGRTLFCKAGLGIGGSRFHYWITELDLANMKLQAITHLQAIFA